MTDVYEKLATIFTEKFAVKAEHRFFSPGRINLIGEHTDYNGGHVFPAAITLGTYGVGSKRNDRKVLLYSDNFTDQGVIEFSLDDIKKDPDGNWGNYVKGVILALKKEGFDIPNGFELVIEGNLPNASGLSSSSSLELLIGVVLERLFDLKTTRLQLVKAGQAAENDFIGVNSGIMDQFAIGFGKKDHAIFLDTNTLEYELVPAEFGNNVILIMNTNKRRELTDSKYNQRRSECETALKKLQTKLDIKSLGELDNKTFDENADLIHDPTLVKRARHAVYENQRTIIAKQALIDGDLEKFGQLINDSHKSLKEDYEVTGVELDTLAQTAQKQAGVLGARMTGAGFGGCAIALVDKDKVDQVKAAVGKAYLDKIGYEASFYVAEIGDGSKALD
ncbi:galactokinase [Oenococcus alcoholitolerans]|uniref:galactokinase n=1 Tax=Oenococcus alcoholitolerans TaxID=931074 RepID=UPI003F714D88